nr:interleukin-27 subunit beta isoform X2 [Desmodus rotundus]
MAPRLLLALALWAGYSPCSGREVPSQLRVWCWAFRYPIAVDCFWTLLAAANSTRPTSVIATYRLGVAAHGESHPCLQPTPEATSCTIPDIRMFSMVPYMLNITAVHAWGVSSGFVPFVPEHISEWVPWWGCGGHRLCPALPPPSPAHLLSATQSRPLSQILWASPSQSVKNYPNSPPSSTSTRSRLITRPNPPGPLSSLVCGSHPLFPEAPEDAFPEASTRGYSCSP